MHAWDMGEARQGTPTVWPWVRASSATCGVVGMQRKLHGPNQATGEKLGSCLSHLPFGGEALAEQASGTKEGGSQGLLGTWAHWYTLC